MDHTSISSYRKFVISRDTQVGKLSRLFKLWFTTCCKITTGILLHDRCLVKIYTCTVVHPDDYFITKFAILYYFSDK